MRCARSPESCCSSALPLIAPLPAGVRARIPTVEPTAELAARLLGLLGVAAERVGDTLHFGESSLKVYEACSGKSTVAQLLVLALLVLCLFATGLARGALVVAVAVVVGFAANVGRVTMLSYFAARDPGQFVFWDDYLMGAFLFPLLASVVAALLWWLILRSPARFSTCGAAAGPG